MDHELVALTQQLLDSLARCDVETYEALCDPSLTGIEPMSMGQILEGLEFHRANLKVKPPHKGETSILSPKVRVIGDVGIISYVRVNRLVKNDGSLNFQGSMETRVWHKRDGKWTHVHFHRSNLPMGA